MRKVFTPEEAQKKYELGRYSKLTAEQFLCQTMETDTWSASRSSDGKTWIGLANDTPLCKLHPDEQTKVLDYYEEAGWIVGYNFLGETIRRPNWFDKLLDRLFNGGKRWGQS